MFYTILQKIVINEAILKINEVKLESEANIKKEIKMVIQKAKKQRN